MTKEVEKIMKEKLEFILNNPSMKTSLIIHLDFYLSILELFNSENYELRSMIEQMIDQSYQLYIKK